VCVRERGGGREAEAEEAEAEVDRGGGREIRKALWLLLEFLAVRETEW